MIVETEAYLGEIDKAAHSYKGRRTPRNEITYQMGGYAYVFFIYGMYFQFNVVTGAENYPHAVLIRALEPIENIGKMRQRRGKMPDKNLTSGPGKLCIALDIKRELNEADLCGEKIWIEYYRTFPKTQIINSKRIGINYAAEFADKPWRFFIKNNPFISRSQKI